MKKILFITLLFCSGALQAQDYGALKSFTRSIERNFSIPLEFYGGQYNENLLLQVAFDGDSVLNIRFSDGAPEVYHRQLAKIKRAFDVTGLQIAFKGMYKGKWNLLIPVFLHNQHEPEYRLHNEYVTPVTYSSFEGLPLSGTMYFAGPIILTAKQIMHKATAAARR